VSIGIIAIRVIRGLLFCPLFTRVTRVNVLVLVEVEMVVFVEVRFGHGSTVEVIAFTCSERQGTVGL